MIVTYDGHFVLVDGEVLGRKHRDSKRGTFALVSADVPGEALVNLATGPRDYVMGGPGEGITGAYLAGGRKGGIVLHYGGVWGMAGAEEEELREGLAEIRDGLDAAGIAMHATAAGTAGSLVRRMVPRLRGLRPRWRETAYRAIHAAPIVQCVGSMEHCAHIDRRAAFLSALGAELPEPEAGYWLGGARTGDALGGEGFVNCTLFVEDTPFPVLPVTTKHGVCYPWGVVTGVWPIPWVRYAVEKRKARVERVAWAIRCKTERWLDPVGVIIDAVEGRARKPLYTRIWGLLCSRGYWRGYVAREGEGQGLREGHVTWVRCETGLIEPSGSKMIRPDVSAYICMDNALAVFRAIDTLEPGSVGYTHLDAIWTSDCSGAARLCGVGHGGWRWEGAGSLRVWRPGVYAHETENGVRIGISGWNSGDGPADYGELDRFGSNSITPHNRTWTAHPAVEPTATSVPHWNVDEGGEAWSTDPRDRAVWTPGGYSRLWERE